MNFTKAVGYLCVLFALAGCSVLSFQSKPEPETDLTEPEAKVKQDQASHVGELPPLILIPNPYLAQKIAVPEQAKKEFAQAAELMGKQQWQAAKIKLEPILAAHSNLSGLHLNQGIIYENLGLMDQAKANYEKAITVNSLNFDAYNRLGLWYRQNGEFDKAKDTYVAALAAWPHHLQININLGILYDLYLGQLDSALYHYQMAEQLLLLEAGDKPDKAMKKQLRKMKGWIVDTRRRLGEHS